MSLYGRFVIFPTDFSYYVSSGFTNDVKSDVTYAQVADHLIDENIDLF